MADFTIRRATLDDARQIGLVHHTSWLETYTGLLAPEFLAARSVEKSTEIFTRERCENMAVAGADGQLVGFASYGAARGNLPQSWGELCALYVLREHQKKGIGRGLLQAALRALREQGFREAGLWVLEGNQNAIDFYGREGFWFDGTEKEVLLFRPVIEKRYRLDLI